MNNEGALFLIGYAIGTLTVAVVVLVTIAYFTKRWDR